MIVNNAIRKTTYNSLEHFLNVCTAQPLLSEQDERALLNKVQNNNDAEAAQSLVMRNMRLVLHVSKRFFNLGLAKEDIVQQGAVGLMLAIKKFDLRWTIRFAGYAKHWIKAEILDFILKNWRIVKVATTKAQKKLFYNYRKLRSLSGELSETQAEAISKALSVPVAAVKVMHERMSSRDEDIDKIGVSFEEPISQNDNPLMIMEAEQDAGAIANVKNALNLLSLRERHIIENRYLTEKPMTLSDLAQYHGVSAERVRQIEAKAIGTLQTAIA